TAQPQRRQGCPSQRPQSPLATRIARAGVRQPKAEENAARDAIDLSRHEPMQWDRGDQPCDAFRSPQGNGGDSERDQQTEQYRRPPGLRGVCGCEIRICRAEITITEPRKPQTIRVVRQIPGCAWRYFFDVPPHRVRRLFYAPGDTAFRTRNALELKYRPRSVGAKKRRSAMAEKIRARLGVTGT